jgi:serine phosphatase RsbU (regulator of sigma subunit)
MTTPSKAAGSSSVVGKQALTALARFFVFYSFFCLLPLGIAGYLAHYSFSFAEEYRHQQTQERLQADLLALLSELEPSFSFYKRFAGFRDRLYASPVTPDRLIRLTRLAEKKWGIPFEPYVFDDQGELITPAQIPLKARRLFQKIWAVLRSITLPLNITLKEYLKRAQENTVRYEKAQREFDTLRKTVKGVLGNDFRVTQLMKHRDYIWSGGLGGRKIHLFWANQPDSPLGGILLVSWETPDLVQRLNYLTRANKARDLSLLVKAPNGSVYSFFQKLPPETQNEVMTLMQTKGETLVKHQDTLWKSAQTGDFSLLIGRRVKITDLRLQKTSATIMVVTFALGGLLLQLFWVVLGKELYLSLRVKFVVLFLFSVAIPMMGLGFLAFKSLRESHRLEVAEATKFCKDVLADLDTRFFEEQNRFRNLCRKAWQMVEKTTSPQLGFPDVARWAHTLLEKRELERLELWDLQGKMLLRVGAEEKDKNVKPIWDSFSRTCMEKHLGDRLLLKNGSTTVPGETGLDLQMKMVLESPDFGFPYILENPDMVHVNTFAGKTGLFWYDVFRGDQFPAAFLLMGQNMEWAVEHFLEKALKRRWAFHSGALRVFAWRHQVPKWFPAGFAGNPTLMALVNQARVTRQVVSRKISWKNAPYLALAVPGTGIAGYSFLALYPEKVIQKTMKGLERSVLMGGLLALLVAVLTGMVLSETFLKPIGELFLGLQALREKKHTFRLPVLQKDELGDLAFAFNDMMGHLQEVNKGRQVQEKLFPRQMLQIGEYRVFGISKPASELGGDYFDYLGVQDRELHVLIGDVTGHGIPAALIMAMVKSVVKVLAEQKYSPAQILEMLNKVIYESMNRTLYMTLSAIAINTHTHEIELFHCGHLFPFKKDNSGNVFQVKSTINYPIGMKLNSPFISTKTTLEPGERLILYTDGLIESLPDPDHKGDNFIQFGKYLALRPELPLIEACKDILENHPSQLGGDPQPDDCTIILIERIQPHDPR